MSGLFTTPVAAYAHSGNDIQNSWAKEQIQRWLDNGLVTGYSDNSFKPKNNITRAEFIAMVNRAFGFSEKAEEMFLDVESGKWYFDDVAKAKAVGYISGYENNKFKPENNISRQEVAAILFRILKLNEDDNIASLEKFSDFNDIPHWSKEYLNEVVKEGYIGGYPDLTCRPKKAITREETVVILDRVVGKYINECGNYGPEEDTAVIEGNLTINKDDVVLKNTTIKGNLYLAAGIGEGNVELDNVTVKGKTIVSGGGEHSIVFTNAILEEIVVYKIGGKVRVVAKGSTKIGKANIESETKLEEEGLTGEGFGEIVVLKAGQSLELAGDFRSVSIKADGVAVKVDGETKIEKLKISEAAEGSSVELAKGSEVGTMLLNSSVEVSGKGEIKKAEINADDIKIEQKVSKITISDDVKSANVGGKKVSKFTSDRGSSSKGSSSNNSKTPDSDNLGITKQVKGAKGSHKVTLTITVKDANGNGISGYQEDDFKARVIMVKKDKFEAEIEWNIENFVDNGDGTYNIDFYGIYGFDEVSYDFYDLTVDSILIEEGPIAVEIPEALVTITAPEYLNNNLERMVSTITGTTNLDDESTIESVYIAIRNDYEYINIDGERLYTESWIEAENTGINFDTWELVLSQEMKDAIDKHEDIYIIDVKIITDQGIVETEHALVFSIVHPSFKAVYIVDDKLYVRSFLDDLTIYSEGFQDLKCNIESNNDSESVYSAVYSSVYGGVIELEIEETPIFDDYKGILYVNFDDRENEYLYRESYDLITLGAVIESESLYPVVFYDGDDDVTFTINEGTIEYDSGSQIPENAHKLQDEDIITVFFEGEELFEAIWNVAQEKWESIE